MDAPNRILALSLALWLAACAAPELPLATQHLSLDSAAAPAPAETRIPQPLQQDFLQPEEPQATFSVSVNAVPAQELLLALARDAGINIDIHPGISGNVTLNALDQTLEQILHRIARQVDMRYTLEQGTLFVLPDTPYLKHYRIDYVNLNRDTEGAIANTERIGTPATGNPDARGSHSSLTIQNTGANHFWSTLAQNLRDLLQERDPPLPDGSSETLVQQTPGHGTAAKAAPKGIEGTVASTPAATELTLTRRSTYRAATDVIVNPENGLISVRATDKQHARIAAFIDAVMTSAQRQVLIEATVVEVRLNKQYQQGINWSVLRAHGSATQAPGGETGASSGRVAQTTASLFVLDYLNPNSRLGNLAASLTLLESFGNVRVLSSPKLSVLNNQTAMLRVVDNLVYFTVKAETTTNQTHSVTTYTTTPNTLPIGFTMSVTPRINDDDTVQINLRPSISRLLGYVDDPNPALTVPSRIPITSTREMESILTIADRQTAVMGGLMQDESSNNTDAVPGLSTLPLAGELFKQRNDVARKTELVIFLRPLIKHDVPLRPLSGGAT